MRARHGLHVGPVADSRYQRRRLERDRGRSRERTPLADLEERVVPRSRGAAVDPEGETQRRIERHGVGRFRLVEVVAPARVLARVLPRSADRPHGQGARHAEVVAAGRDRGVHVGQEVRGLVVDEEVPVLAGARGHGAHDGRVVPPGVVARGDVPVQRVGRCPVRIRAGRLVQDGEEIGPHAGNLALRQYEVIRGRSRGRTAGLAVGIQGVARIGGLPAHRDLQGFSVWGTEAVVLRFHRTATRSG